MHCTLVVLAVCLALLVAACGRNEPLVSASPASPTPAPPAYSIAGIVREVNGGPLAGVGVAAASLDTDPYGPEPIDPSTTTNGSGAFSLDGLTRDDVLFWKDGYLASLWNKRMSASPTGTLTIKLQPRMWLSVDLPVSSLISYDDLAYSLWGSNNACSPCKQIQLDLRDGSRWPFPRDGIRLRLHSISATALDVWVGRYYFGVTASAQGAAGDFELALDVPDRFDTVFVGVGRRGGVAQSLSAIGQFVLTVEPR